MKLVPIRFKGFEWHHNPKEISFICDKQVNELKSPNGKSYIQNLGRNNTIINGKGELFGNDCLAQFNSLLKLFKEGGVGVLAIPQLAPVFAVFENLKILGEPKPDILSYSFSFREVMEKKFPAIPDFYILQEKDTLWDVSFMFDIPIDSLVQLNPHIKMPNITAEGVKIALC